MDHVRSSSHIFKDIAPLGTTGFATSFQEGLRCVRPSSSWTASVCGCCGIAGWVFHHLLLLALFAFFVGAVLWLLKNPMSFRLFSSSGRVSVSGGVFESSTEEPGQQGQQAKDSARDSVSARGKKVGMNARQVDPDFRKKQKEKEERESKRRQELKGGGVTPPSRDEEGDEDSVLANASSSIG